MEKPDQPKLTGATEEPAPKEEPKAQAAQPDPQPAWTPTPAPSKTTGFFKSLGTWLMILVMLGLSGAVLYLMSDLNRRTYKLAQVGDTMVVQKGRFMPTGFENYQPEETRLRQAYAPIQIPQVPPVSPMANNWRLHESSRRTIVCHFLVTLDGRIQALRVSPVPRVATDLSALMEPNPAVNGFCVGS